MRKVICVLLVVTVLLGCCSTAFAKEGSVYRVNASGLRMRSMPKGGEDNASNILTTLSYGRKVVHLSSRGRWWFVRTDGGKIGWVFAPYLTPDTLGVAVKAADNIYTVKCHTLNIRENPSTSSDIIGKLFRGRTIRVSAVKNGWGKIKNNQGKVGYISMNYLG